MSGRTFAVALDPDQFASVFGKPKEDRVTGRSRRCRVCGDWHSLEQPWPHNCRAEAPPRNPDLASPMLFPKFEPFRPDMLGDPDLVINDRREKIDYMERNDLAEYDAGAAKPAEAEWVRERKWDQVFVEDIKAAQEMDPLAVEPVDVVGQTDLGEATEVDTTVMPTIDVGGPT